jgi:DNA-binding MarR family transcriptional regulator
MIQSILDSMLVIKRSVAACHHSELKNMPITPSQWAVLDAVMESGDGIALTSLAKSLKITSPAASQLVEGLCEKGFLIRQPDPNDRRSMVIRLTKKHFKKMAKMKEGFLERFMDVFDVLSDEELRECADLNGKVAKHADRH